MFAQSSAKQSLPPCLTGLRSVLWSVLMGGPLERGECMANAMVIGIGGVGSVIGQKLHEYDCFDRIVLADLEPVFARQLVSRMPRNRFVIVQANAMETERLA